MTSIPFLILGSFLLERYFSIPGIGSLTIDALNRGDLPILKAVTVLGAIALVVFPAVGPAVRLGRPKGEAVMTGWAALQSLWRRPQARVCLLLLLLYVGIAAAGWIGLLPNIKEYLLFDFSLDMEDSINECLAYYIFQLSDLYEYPKIDSIKYELDFYGKSRSHFYSFGYFDLCKFWHVPGYIMEGFGFKDGPFRGQLNRRWVKYCEGTLEQCNIISSTKDDQFSRANKIVILPNPAFDYISFRLNESIVNATNGYGIRNITGNMLEKESLIDFGTNYIIHTHDFPSGIHFTGFKR